MNATLPKDVQKKIKRLEKDLWAALTEQAKRGLELEKIRAIVRAHEDVMLDVVLEKLDEVLATYVERCTQKTPSQKDGKKFI